MKFRLSALIPLLIFSFIGLALAIGLRNDPRAMPSTMIDRDMPAFTLQAVSDDLPLLQHSDLLGKISLLNVFGSWCTACLHEHPTLMRLSRQNRIAIYGVDWRDTPSAGANWLRVNGNPYAAVGLDSQSHLAIDLGVTGAPETYLIDPKGRIRFKQIGPITEQVWRDTIEPMVRLLEAEQ
ncbi:MAG: DsbE family thiol:disulfide interchange protein [Robiginitomaculum sp.]|nr:MAG: DsbE family thiol:disulfide interchange protein [Robiginitomaculum sp.]